MLKGNKGEWSEVYALLKIISDRKLFSGNSDLEIIEDLFFPILKVIRDESIGSYNYTYADSGDVVVISGDEEAFRIPITTFQEQAALLLSKIKESTTSAFSIQETEDFINSFNCTSLKASSSVKSDIRIVIHDTITGRDPELGFSIKSQLGGASTLLNAGKTTNFIYKIDGPELDDDQVAEINEIDSRSKIKDRIEKIQELSCRLNFAGTENPIFGNNLTLIDSFLPEILSDIVLLFYSSPYSTVIDLVDEISKRNPADYDLRTGHPFYHYKIKRFLTDIALGMMPAKVWTGALDATGGYLVVKDTGDILCYHIYNRNAFEDYLLNNTKLETASSTRHGFGKIYKKDNETFFKLNLQIRFRK